MDDIRTFKDLYEYLQSCHDDDIFNWLHIRWEGKDKQESLLRLFSGLSIIPKIKDFNICKGNFNSKTIQTHNTIKDIFYIDNNTLINLKDKGDSSDLTGIHISNPNHLLVTTSKNLNKTNIGVLDIDPILTHFNTLYNGYTMSLCISVRDLGEFNSMKERIESLSLIHI